MNFKKILVCVFLGIAGFASVTSVTACDPINIPIQTNFDDLFSKIKEHIFTKETINLSEDEKIDKVKVLENSIRDSLIKVFKDKVNNFDKIFSIENILIPNENSLSNQKKQLTSDDIDKFDANHEKILEVVYKLFDLKDKSKNVTKTFMVKVCKKNNQLLYGTNDGFSIEKLDSTIIDSIMQELPLLQDEKQKEEFLQEDILNLTTRIDEDKAEISAGQTVIDLVKGQLGQLLVSPSEDKIIDFLNLAKSLLDGIIKNDNLTINMLKLETERSDLKTQVELETSNIRKAEKNVEEKLKDFNEAKDDTTKLAKKSQLVKANQDLYDAIFATVKKIFSEDNSKNQVKINEIAINIDKQKLDTLKKSSEYFASKDNQDLKSEIEKLESDFKNKSVKDDDSRLVGVEKDKIMTFKNHLDELKPELTT